MDDLHAPIWREQEEPRDGFEPVPIWLMAAFGALLFWGGFYLATYSGYFSEDVFDGTVPTDAVGVPPPG